jgi:hypothetical protein
MQMPAVVVLLVAGEFLASAFAQPLLEDPSGVWVSRAKARMSSLQPQVLDPTTGQSIPAPKLIDRPLLVFGDPTRNNESGTLWAWGTSGRPAAFVELYRSDGNQDSWVHAATMTAPIRWSLPTGDGRTWRPQEIAWQPIPITADPPAENERQRLRQMKAIAQQLSGHEFWEPGNSRYELRLLPQPVHRYSAADQQILDGAVVVLAHGTNPEIIVLLEAVGQADQPARWQLVAVPLGSAELVLQYEKQTVWTQPRAPGITGQPQDPYWLFVTSMTPTEAPPAETPQKADQP